MKLKFTFYILMFICNIIIIVANYLKDSKAHPQNKRSKNVHSKTNKTILFTSIISAILILGVTIVEFINFSRNEKLDEITKKNNTYEGIIRAPIQNKEKCLSTSIFKDLNDDDLINIHFGGLHFGNSKKTFKQGINPPIPLQIGNYVPFKIKLQNDTLLISLVIYDREGKVICEINDNKFTINKNNIFKRNFDESAIEVVDQYNNVAISLEINDSHNITINGIIMIPKRMCFFAHGNDTEFLDCSSYDNISHIEQMMHKSWDEVYLDMAKKIPKLFSYVPNNPCIRLNK